MHTCGLLSVAYELTPPTRTRTNTQDFARLADEVPTEAAEWAAKAAEATARVRAPFIAIRLTLLPGPCLRAPGHHPAGLTLLVLILTGGDAGRCACRAP